MRRWHQEYFRTRRVWLKHLRLVHDWPTGPIDCSCEFQVGRFRKGERAGGCGRARCQVCHYYKFPKRIRTRAERVAAFSAREQAAELGLVVK